MQLIFWFREINSKQTQKIHGTLSLAKVLISFTQIMTNRKLILV